jgi:hypothetical protein
MRWWYYDALTELVELSSWSCCKGQFHVNACGARNLRSTVDVLLESRYFANLGRPDAKGFLRNEWQPSTRGDAALVVPRLVFDR